MINSKNVFLNKHIVLSLAVIAIISYFIHILLGYLYYEGYNPLSQAISDLTAEDSPVKSIARVFSNLYGFFSVCAMILLLLKVKDFKHKKLKLGVIIFTIMITMSAIGFAFFPLSEAGYAGTFKDIMHMVITFFVVILTLISLVLFIIAFKSVYQWISIITLTLILLSAILMAFIPNNYFGVLERVSVYSVIFYFGFLSYVFSYKKGDLYEVN